MSDATPNIGEIADADAVGTAGSPGCGDMMRVWIKFRDGDKGKVIDRASFQGFGCETAMAVAGAASELLKGKTVEEARSLKGDALSEPLGPLPPMKIHCATLVEEALRQALDGGGAPATATAPPPATTGNLVDSFMGDARQSAPKKIVFLKPGD